MKFDTTYELEQELVRMGPTEEWDGSVPHHMAMVKSAPAPRSKLKPLSLIVVSLIAAAFVAGVAVDSWVLKPGTSQPTRAVDHLPDVVGLNTGNLRRKRRVFIFRHCIRSTKKKVNGTDARMFTKHELPHWGTPKSWCTSGGHDIMRWTGQKLATDFGVDRRMLKITADVIMRDVQTGLALLEGITNPTGEKTNPVISSEISFDGSMENTIKTEGNAGPGSPACESPDPSILLPEIRKALATMPFPAGVGLMSSANFSDKFTAVLKRLEEIVGKGSRSFVDASLPYASDDSKNGYVFVTSHGAYEILKFFSQQMVYAWGSGQPWVDWDGQKMSQSDYMSWNAWEYFSRGVKIPRGWKVTAGTKMIQTILSDLKDPSQGGLSPGATHIVTGHDTTLDCLRAGLNLTWTAPPFHIWPDGFVFPGSGPTPPGSALVFTMDEGSEEVKLDFLYPVFDGSTTPDVITRPVRSFANLKALERRAKDVSNEYDAAKACWAKVEASMRDM